MGLFQVAEEELETALMAAVTCCILAAAGPQRSRVLANLYKDERVSRLPTFGFLEKVFFERILQQDEVIFCPEIGPYTMWMMAGCSCGKVHICKSS